MADTVTSKVLPAATGQSTRHYGVRLTNISDGTGESNVIKIALSGLKGPDGITTTTFPIEELVWNIQGFTSITLAWDHNTDITIDVLSGQGYRDYRNYGLLCDSGTGGTGDVILTTNGAASGATYDITIIGRL